MQASITTAQPKMNPAKGGQEPPRSTAPEKLLSSIKPLPANSNTVVALKRHVRARAVDNDRLPEELKELHRKREEMGLTIQDLAEITGVPVGTVNKRFYDQSRDVPNPIRELIESEYEQWIRPENVARRAEIESLSMEQIVEQWASWIGGASLSLEQKFDLLADALILNVNPLTIERQVSGKRERWKTQRIMRYERKVIKSKKGREARALLEPPSANDAAM